MGEQANSGDEPDTEIAPEVMASRALQPPLSQNSGNKAKPMDPNLQWILPVAGVVLLVIVAANFRDQSTQGTSFETANAAATDAPPRQQPSAESNAEQAKAELARQKALEQQNRLKIAGLLDDIKTVPERQYELRLSLWQEVTALAPANSTYAAGRQKAADALASVKNATENPEVFGASIERTVGNKAGFGNVLVVDLTIRNDSLSNLKDFQITCAMFGNSGTEMGSVTRVMYETVEARSSRTFRRFNMGFVDHQAASTTCQLRRASIA